MLNLLDALIYGTGLIFMVLCTIAGLAMLAVWTIDKVKFMRKVKRWTLDGMARAKGK